MRLLNASGCLDALTAPAVAAELDAFVTKTITPFPRVGNEPVRIAETEVGMLDAIGLANPGVDGFLHHALTRLDRVRVLRIAGKSDRGAGGAKRGAGDVQLHGHGRGPRVHEFHVHRP